MTKKTKDELQIRQREIQDRMSEMNDKVMSEKREKFTEDEQREWNNLSREYEMNQREITSQMTDEELAKHREVVSKGEQLREYLKNVSYQPY